MKVVRRKSPRFIATVSLDELHRAGGCLDKGKFRYLTAYYYLYDEYLDRKVRVEYVVRIKLSALNTPAALDNDNWERVELPVYAMTKEVQA